MRNIASSTMLHNELDIIRTIQKTLGKPSSRVVVGIGDDAAVTRPPRGKMVATVDTMVEGVHFDLAYTTPRELGHKALAVNLSDMAAMGARPLFALVSLGLTQHLNDFFVTELYRGMGELARRFKVEIIGGNLVQSPSGLIADVALIGEATGRYFTRGGARPGDLVAVTGTLGASAAGLNCLRRLGRHQLGLKTDEIVRAHLLPTPRIVESLALLKTGAVTAMIDISDGLAKELSHLAESSDVGMAIDASSIPLSEQTHHGAALLNSNALAWALYGGEDYELLFTFRRQRLQTVKKALRGKLTVLGEVTSAKLGLKIREEGGKTVELKPKGWNHFVKRGRGGN